MNEANDFDMRVELRGIGIVSISEQDRIIDVARKCAKTGVLVGVSWAALGAPALAPGIMAGFLSGFATGTASCMGLSYAAKETLKKIGIGLIATPR